MSKANKTKWQKGVLGLLNAVNDNNKIVREMINYGFTENIISVLFNIKFLNFNDEMRKALPDTNLQYSGGEGGSGFNETPLPSPDQLSNLFDNLFGTARGENATRFSSLLTALNTRANAINIETRRYERLAQYGIASTPALLTRFFSLIYTGTRGYFSDIENTLLPDTLENFLNKMTEEKEFNKFISDLVYADREKYTLATRKEYIKHILKICTDALQINEKGEYVNQTAVIIRRKLCKALGIDNQDTKVPAVLINAKIQTMDRTKKKELFLIILNMACNSTDFKAAYAVNRAKYPNTAPLTLTVKILASLFGPTGDPTISNEDDDIVIVGMEPIKDKTLLFAIIEVIKNFLQTIPDSGLIIRTEPFNPSIDGKEPPEEGESYNQLNSLDLTKRVNELYEELETLLKLTEDNKPLLFNILKNLVVEFPNNIITDDQLENIRKMCVILYMEAITDPTIKDKPNIFINILNFLSIDIETIKEVAKLLLIPSTENIKKAVNDIINDFKQKNPILPPASPPKKIPPPPFRPGNVYDEARDYLAQEAIEKGIRQLETFVPATTSPATLGYERSYRSPTMEELAELELERMKKDKEYVQRLDGEPLFSIRASKTPPIERETPSIERKLPLNLSVEEQKRLDERYDEIKRKLNQSGILDEQEVKEEVKNNQDESKSYLRRQFEQLTSSFGNDWRLTRNYSFTTSDNNIYNFHTIESAMDGIDLLYPNNPEMRMNAYSDIIVRYGLFRTVGKPYRTDNKEPPLIGGIAGGGGGDPGGGDAGGDITGGYYRLRDRFKGLTKKSWIKLVALIILLSTGVITIDDLIKGNKALTNNGKVVDKPPDEDKPSGDGGGGGGGGGGLLPTKYSKIQHSEFWDSVGLGGVIDTYNGFVDEYNSAKLTKSDVKLLNEKINEYWGKLSKATGVPELNELLQARKNYDDLRKQYDDATANGLNFSNILGIYTALKNSASYLDTMTQKYLNIENGIFGTAKSLTDADVTIDDKDDPGSIITKMQTQVKAKAIVDPSSLILSKGMLERIARKLANQGDFSSGIMSETQQFNNFSVVKNHEYPNGLGLDNPLMRRNKEYEISQYVNANPNPMPYIVPSYNKCLRAAKHEAVYMHNPIMIDDKLDDANWNPIGNQIKLKQPTVKSSLFYPENEIQKHSNKKKIETMSDMIRSGPYTDINVNPHHQGGTIQYNYNQKLNQYPITSEFKQVKPTKVTKYVSKVKKSRVPDNYSLK